MGELKIFPAEKWKNAHVGKKLLDALTSAADHAGENGVVAYAVLVVSEDNEDNQIVFYRHYADTSADVVGLVGMMAMGIRMDMITLPEQDGNK